MKTNSFIGFLLLAAAALLLNGCSKTTITIDEGGNTSSGGSSEDSSGSGTTTADNLVGFHATVESLDMTRSMSPIATGTVVRIFAYHGGTDETHSTSPIARGTYSAQQAGTLTGNSGYKMYLSNGTFDFYAVSTNTDTVPPTFQMGTSTALANGVDYL